MQIDLAAAQEPQSACATLQAVRREAESIGHLGTALAAVSAVALHLLKTGYKIRH